MSPHDNTFSTSHASHVTRPPLRRGRKNDADSPPQQQQRTRESSVIASDRFDSSPCVLQAELSAIMAKHAHLKLPTSSDLLLQANQVSPMNLQDRESSMSSSEICQSWIAYETDDSLSDASINGSHDSTYFDSESIILAGDTFHDFHPRLPSSQDRVAVHSHCSMSVSSQHSVHSSSYSESYHSCSHQLQPLVRQQRQQAGMLEVLAVAGATVLVGGALTAWRKQRLRENMRR